MISNAYCQLMAEYNQWMNSKLYRALEPLGEQALRTDKGAFFGSIFMTLNHIFYGDLIFLSRLTGDPLTEPELDQVFFESFAAMKAGRVTLDQRLLTWATSLTDDWLEKDASYISKVDGSTKSAPRWVLVSHMFNHQTHHRGQITTLLSQLDIDIGPTDIPFMPRFS